MKAKSDMLAGSEVKTEVKQQQTCSRKNPTLSSPENDKNGQKDETVTYSVELKNNNSPCKDPADFDISVDKPKALLLKKSLLLTD